MAMLPNDVRVTSRFSDSIEECVARNYTSPHGDNGTLFDEVLVLTGAAASDTGNDTYIVGDASANTRRVRVATTETSMVTATIR